MIFRRVSPASEMSTRQRILYTGAELFRRQGYAGTGIKQILAEAEAAFGSLYHFFPTGKEELAKEVLEVGGQFFLSLYESIAEDAPDLPAAVRDFFAGAAATLQATDFADACPIATIAGEVASSHPVLREAAADAFESWLAALTEDAIDAGVSEERARPLAVSVLALLEGAFLLSRSLRDLEPMSQCGEAAVGLVQAAVQEPVPERSPR